MSEKPRKREIVIEALLIEPTLEAAAKRSKVSSRTIRRWLRDDQDFAASYRAARRQLFDSAMSRLVALTEQAIARLAEILQDRNAPANAVLGAARTTLERAFAAQQIDLEERLAQIERELEHLAEETP